VIKLTGTDGNPVLVNPHYVMAVIGYSGDTREYKLTPCATIFTMGGIAFNVVETPNDYYEIERLGLGEAI